MDNLYEYIPDEEEIRPTDKLYITDQEIMYFRRNGGIDITVNQVLYKHLNKYTNNTIPEGPTDKSILMTLKDRSFKNIFNNQIKEINKLAKLYKMDYKTINNTLTQETILLIKAFNCINKVSNGNMNFQIIESLANLLTEVLCTETPAKESTRQFYSFIINHVCTECLNKFTRQRGHTDHQKIANFHRVLHKKIGENLKNKSDAHTRCFNRNILSICLESNIYNPNDDEIPKFPFYIVNEERLNDVFMNNYFDINGINVCRVISHYKKYNKLLAANLEQEHNRKFGMHVMLDYIGNENEESFDYTSSGNVRFDTRNSETFTKIYVKRCLTTLKCKYENFATSEQENYGNGDDDVVARDDMESKIYNLSLDLTNFADLLGESNINDPFLINIDDLITNPSELFTLISMCTVFYNETINQKAVFFAPDIQHVVHNTIKIMNYILSSKYELSVVAHSTGSTPKLLLFYCNIIEYCNMLITSLDGKEDEINASCKKQIATILSFIGSYIEEIKAVAEVENSKDKLYELMRVTLINYSMLSEKEKIECTLPFKANDNDPEARHTFQKQIDSLCDTCEVERVFYKEQFNDYLLEESDYEYDQDSSRGSLSDYEDNQGAMIGGIGSNDLLWTEFPANDPRPPISQGSRRDSSSSVESGDDAWVFGQQPGRGIYDTPIVQFPPMQGKSQLYSDTTLPHVPPISQGSRRDSVSDGGFNPGSQSGRGIYNTPIVQFPPISQGSRRDNSGSVENYGSNDEYWPHLPSLRPQGTGGRSGINLGVSDDDDIFTRRDSVSSSSSVGSYVSDNGDWPAHANRPPMFQSSSSGSLSDYEDNQGATIGGNNGEGGGAFDNGEVVEVFDDFLSKIQKTDGDNIHGAVNAVFGKVNNIVNEGNEQGKEEYIKVIGYAETLPRRVVENAIYTHALSNINTDLHGDLNLPSYSNKEIEDLATVFMNDPKDPFHAILENGLTKSAQGGKLNLPAVSLEECERLEEIEKAKRKLSENDFNQVFKGRSLEEEVAAEVWQPPEEEVAVEVWLQEDDEHVAGNDDRNRNEEGGLNEDDELHDAEHGQFVVIDDMPHGHNEGDEHVAGNDNRNRNEEGGLNEDDEPHDAEHEQFVVIDDMPHGHNEDDEHVAENDNRNEEGGLNEDDEHVAGNDDRNEGDGLHERDDEHVVGNDNRNEEGGLNEDDEPHEPEQDQIVVRNDITHGHNKGIDQQVEPAQYQAQIPYAEAAPHKEEKNKRERAQILLNRFKTYSVNDDKSATTPGANTAPTQGHGTSGDGVLIIGNTEPGATGNQQLPGGEPPATNKSKNKRSKKIRPVIRDKKSIFAPLNRENTANNKRLLTGRVKNDERAALDVPPIQYQDPYGNPITPPPPPLTGTANTAAGIVPKAPDYPAPPPPLPGAVNTASGIVPKAPDYPAPPPPLPGTANTAAGIVPKAPDYPAPPPPLPGTANTAAGIVPKAPDYPAPPPPLPGTPPANQHGAPGAVHPGTGIAVNQQPPVNQHGAPGAVHPGTGIAVNQQPPVNQHGTPGAVNHDDNEQDTDDDDTQDLYAGSFNDTKKKLEHLLLDPDLNKTQSTHRPTTNKLNNDHQQTQQTLGVGLQNSAIGNAGPGAGTQQPPPPPPVNQPTAGGAVLPVVHQVAPPPGTTPLQPPVNQPGAPGAVQPGTGIAGNQQPPVNQHGAPGAVNHDDNEQDTDDEDDQDLYAGSFNNAKTKITNFLFDPDHNKTQSTHRPTPNKSNDNHLQIQQTLGGVHQNSAIGNAGPGAGTQQPPPPPPVNQPTAGGAVLPVVHQVAPPPGTTPLQPPVNQPGTGGTAHKSDPNKLNTDHLKAQRNLETFFKKQNGVGNAGTGGPGPGGNRGASGTATNATRKLNPKLIADMQNIIAPPPPGGGTQHPNTGTQLPPGPPLPPPPNGPPLPPPPGGGPPPPPPLPAIGGSKNKPLATGVGAQKPATGGGAQKPAKALKTPPPVGANPSLLAQLQQRFNERNARLKNKPPADQGQNSQQPLAPGTQPPIHGKGQQTPPGGPPLPPGSVPNPGLIPPPPPNGPPLPPPNGPPLPPPNGPPLPPPNGPPLPPPNGPPPPPPNGPPLPPGSGPNPGLIPPPPPGGGTPTTPLQDTNAQDLYDPNDLDIDKIDNNDQDTPTSNEPNEIDKQKEKVTAKSTTRDGKTPNGDMMSPFYTLKADFIRVSIASVLCFAFVAGAAALFAASKGSFGMIAGGLLLCALALTTIVYCTYIIVCVIKEIKQNLSTQPQTIIQDPEGKQDTTQKGNDLDQDGTHMITAQE